MFSSNVSIILKKHFQLLLSTVVRKLDELFSEVEGLLLLWIDGQTERIYMHLDQANILAKSLALFEMLQERRDEKSK
jgi:hypothetical protein